MTTAEAFQKECEEITHRTGRYIPPYRMASLMRTAQKITDMLSKADVCMTYEEWLRYMATATTLSRSNT